MMESTILKNWKSGYKDVVNLVLKYSDYDSIEEHKNTVVRCNIYNFKSRSDVKGIKCKFITEKMIGEFKNECVSWNNIYYIFNCVWNSLTDKDNGGNHNKVYMDLFEGTLVNRHVMQFMEKFYFGMRLPYSCFLDYMFRVIFGDQQTHNKIIREVGDFNYLFLTDMCKIDYKDAYLAMFPKYFNFKEAERLMSFGTLISDWEIVCLTSENRIVDCKQIINKTDIYHYFMDFDMLIVRVNNDIELLRLTRLLTKNKIFGGVYVIEGTYLCSKLIVPVII